MSFKDRIEEIRQIRPGWLYDDRTGKCFGDAYKDEDLDWLLSVVPENIIEPYASPFDGNVIFLEWGDRDDPWELNLEIFLDTKKADLMVHHFRKSNKGYHVDGITAHHALEVDLEDPENWRKIGRIAEKTKWRSF